jgi:tetratricopeptide (TPR) repeat protein
MASGKKAPPNFWSMGSTASLAVRPAAPGRDSLLAEAQSRLKAGDLSKAMALAQQAVKMADNASTRLALATVCLVAGDLRHAESNYVKALQHQPRHFKALLGLGQLKLNSSKAQEAIQLLKAAVEIEPQNIDARHLLARSYGLNSQIDDALALFEPLTRDAPHSPEIWAGYGRTLMFKGKAENAIEAYKQAIALNPSDDAAHQGLSVAYMATGRLDLAELHAKNAIRIRPDRGDPYTKLGKMKLLRNTDIGPLKQQLAQLPPDDPKRIPCLSGIAMAAEGAGDHATCFAAVSEALDITFKRRRGVYDPQGMAKYTDDVIGIFGQTPATAQDAVGQARPIFIVGAPRSGTTLTEQILARHLLVYAAGESPAMNKVTEAMASLGKPYPKGFSELSSDDIKQLIDVYYSAMPAEEMSKTAMTDKMLKNTFNLPLIALMFPEARIVKCCRHPMDVVWSIMSQVFGRSLPFASKMENICHYILEESRVFDVWMNHQSLPTLEVYYEELVERFDEKARALVSFTGLEWDDACLMPQESTRAVMTASAGQVHRPVSKSSIGRWRPFAPYLTHAAEVLKPLIERHEAELARRGISL